MPGVHSMTPTIVAISLRMGPRYPGVGIGNPGRAAPYPNAVRGRKTARANRPALARRASSARRPIEGQRALALRQRATGCRSAGPWSILPAVKIANVRAVIPRGTNEPSDWRTAMAQIAVLVETDAGLTGLGVGGGGRAGVHVVETVLREVLLGRDPSDIDGLWTAMYRATLPFGRKGVAVWALSGVDLALWDLAGKAREKPVYALLGELRNPAIPVYASIGHEVGHEAERGFGHVKLHMPRPSPGFAANVDVVRRARERLGPEIALYVDAFLEWDVETTLRLADAFVAFDVRWIEEPLSPDDLDGYAVLCRRSPIPIAGGEHECGPRGFEEVVARRAHQILQPDASWCGGLTALREIFQLGAESGLCVVPHRGAEVWGLHAIAALSPAPLAESGRPWVTWLRGEPRIERGVIRPTDAPGFGVELDPAALP
jgi:L-rhamnonate dehydratase